MAEWLRPWPFNYWQYPHAENKYPQRDLTTKPFGGLFFWHWKCLWHDSALQNFKRTFKFGSWWETPYFNKKLFKKFTSAHWVYCQIFIFRERVYLRAVSCTLLFSLKVSGILNRLPHSVHGNRYIDDLKIFCQRKDMKYIERQLQLALKRIIAWLNRNGFTFSKCTQWQDT